MARNKTLPHMGEEFIPAAEPPSALEMQVADAVLAPFLNDPDPEAYFESIKRSDYKTYFAMLKDAIAVKSRAMKALPHTRATVTAISPIGPKKGVVDVTPSS
jgi:hypothetical protein